MVIPHATTAFATTAFATPGTLLSMVRLRAAPNFPRSTSFVPASPAYFPSSSYANTAPRAVYSLDFYRAQEGFQDEQSVFLPNSIIYSSLRRRAEKSAFEASLSFLKDLAANGIISQNAILPSKALSPREVVQAVLKSLRGGDLSAALQFASRKNPVSKLSSKGLHKWLDATEDYRFLLNVCNFFVAPQGRSYGVDRKSCVISCVVNTNERKNFALNFDVSRDEDTDAWMVDGVSLG